MRTRWPDAAGRRRALDAALGEGGMLDVLDDGAADRIDAWLASAAQPDSAQQVVITLVSDDPDDLTLRQARLLGSADAILHDAAVPPAILDRARADAVRWPLPCSRPVPPGLCIVLKRA